MYSNIVTLGDFNTHNNEQIIQTKKTDLETMALRHISPDRLNCSLKGIPSKSSRIHILCAHGTFFRIDHTKATK